MCEYDLAGRYTWLEGGSGGGGAGYAGGVGGNGGSGTCDSGGTGISCGLFGCFGVDYIYGWAVPGGGGGGGSTFVGGALGAGYGWPNPAPSGTNTNSPGGAVLLGTWPAKTLAGPMIVASAPVRAISWSG